MQQGRGGSHFDCLLHVADLQTEIQPRLLIDLNHDVTGARGAEAGGLDFDGVLAGIQVTDFELAVRGGLCRAFDSGGGLRNAHHCVGDNGAARIGYGSKDSCVERLCE